MTPSEKSFALNIVLVLALLLTIFSTFVYKAKFEIERSIPLSDRILTECESLDIAEDLGDGSFGPGVGPDLAAILMSAGWEGKPGDGREAIYSPAC